MCKELTSSDEVIISSADYVQPILLTESIELLQDVIDKISDPKKAKQLSQYLNLLSFWSTGTQNTWQNQMTYVVQMACNLPLAIQSSVEQKLQSYMAHEVWCTNQNIAI